MASTKSLHFKCPYLRQNWSIPDSIIYSMTFNPSNVKAWQKLIQSCKYFFAKNAILVVDELHYDFNKKWEVVFFKVKNGEKTRLNKIINFKSALYKIWLIEKFFVSGYYYYEQAFNNLVSSIIPYFYRCDIKTSKISNQEITYDQFKFIFSKVEDVFLNRCVVRNKNEILPFEKLVKALPNIKKLTLQDKTSYSCITSNTAKEVLKIPHISKITEVILEKLPENFDLETFYIYFKKNKHTKFRLHFSDSISEAYKIRLEAIVDEIIAAENNDYKIPFIYFDGLPYEKWGKIDSLIRQQNKQ